MGKRFCYGVITLDGKPPKKERLGGWKFPRIEKGYTACKFPYIGGLRDACAKMLDDTHAKLWEVESRGTASPIVQRGESKSIPSLDFDRLLSKMLGRNN